MKNGRQSCNPTALQVHTPATVTENVQEAVLPAASRVSHSTWVKPTANWLPDPGLQVTEVTPTLSVTLGDAHKTTAPVPLVAAALTLAGQLIVGAVSSAQRGMHDATVLHAKCARSTV